MPAQTQTLKVKWGGDKLSFKSTATGKVYEYVPARDNGLLVVDSADVPFMLSLTFANGENGKRTPYFTL